MWCQFESHNGILPASFRLGFDFITDRSASAKGGRGKREQCAYLFLLSRLGNPNRKLPGLLGRHSGLFPSSRRDRRGGTCQRLRGRNCSQGVCAAGAADSDSTSIVPRQPGLSFGKEAVDLVEGQIQSGCHGARLEAVSTVYVDGQSLDGQEASRELQRANAEKENFRWGTQPGTLAQHGGPQDGPVRLGRGETMMPWPKIGHGQGSKTRAQLSSHWLCAS